MTENDLKQIERSTFKAAADSGLWDIFLASVVAMFAIAPLLSGRLGDFWSSAVFLPVWAVVYLVIHIVKIRVIRPRIGVVEFARSRRKRLIKLTVTMLAVNVVALVMGIVAATQAQAGKAPIFTLIFPPLVILIGFSLAAFFLEIPRVFLYGLLIAGAPFIGEVLFRRGYVAHHGFPVVFGVCTVVILLSGIVRFARFLPRGQRGSGTPPAEGNHE